MFITSRVEIRVCKESVTISSIDPISDAVQSKSTSITEKDICTVKIIGKLMLPLTYIMKYVTI